MMANEISQEKVQTREEVKKKKQKVQGKRKKRIRIRILPIWLRLILFIMLVAASLAGGLMVGYGVIGDGNAKDVFQKETWLHILDLVNKDQ